MSNEAVNAAVEAILADPVYAGQVYESPEQALCARFDLSGNEWRSIARSLQEDVKDELGDVAGHGLSNRGLGLMEFRATRQLPIFKNDYDRIVLIPPPH